MFKFSFRLRENGEREKERVYMSQTGIFVRLDLESFKLSQRIINNSFDFRNLNPISPLLPSISTQFHFYFFFLFHSTFTMFQIGKAG
jgi:hypothetical protein